MSESLPLCFPVPFLGFLSFCFLFRCVCFYFILLYCIIPQNLVCFLMRLKGDRPEWEREREEEREGKL